MDINILEKSPGKYKLAYIKDGKRYSKSVSADDDNEAHILLDKFIDDINKNSELQEHKK